jgi:tetratricopeptide (TPR) repeat protein
MRLQVPSKARSEFEKACGDVKKRKLLDAEQHARYAIEKYPNYVAAWVMLGQVLEGLQRTEEARDACEHALDTDPTYLPPYLCLTEIYASNEQWDSVLNLTEFVLTLNPAGAGYVYFFRALAYYRTQRFAEAEKSALDAASMDGGQGEAPIYFLLAKIYEVEGKSAVAAAQMRRFLKLSPDRKTSTEAKRYLAKLEGQQATN